MKFASDQARNGEGTRKRIFDSAERRNSRRHWKQKKTQKERKLPVSVKNIRRKRRRRKKIFQVQSNFAGTGESATRKMKWWIFKHSNAAFLPGNSFASPCAIMLYITSCISLNARGCFVVICVMQFFLKPQVSIYWRSNVFTWFGLVVKSWTWHSLIAGFAKENLSR